MERVFWIKCPKCSGRFYADYGMRHAKVRLICPFCADQFLPEESPDLDERWVS